jgi:predicted peptidase
MGIAFRKFGFCPVALALVALLITTAARAGDGDERVEGVGPLARGLFTAVDTADFKHDEFVAHDGTRVRYRLLAPLAAEPGKRYPLVVQLHSSGGVGSDNEKQLERPALSWGMPPIRERYRTYVLVPQFEQRSANYDSPDAPTYAVASPALPAMLELVEHVAERHAVDRDRIYAVGFSMGGSTAWLSAAARPKLFAAIVPIGAVAPGNEVAKALTRVPVWAMHGDADTENPIAADRRLVAQIRSLGGERLRLREYVGLDHQLPADFYPGEWWRDWLFAQHRN